jgi:2-hydroxychromene-2-carboxylate isomerase
MTMATIEYFYSAHSAFAYVGSARLMQIAKAAGVTIVHKPMDLRRVIDAVYPPPGRQAFRTPARASYFFGREIERWSEYRGVAIMKGRPTHHDNGIELCNCVLIAGLQAGIDINPLAHAMLEAHWRNDADLADPGTLARLAHDVGLEPEPLLTGAVGMAARDTYEANTRESIERSVFGSPTYFVGGDMFYGQDHLELVERALAKPFGGTWPRP